MATAPKASPKSPMVYDVPRGIYRLPHRIAGRRVFLAITSEGELLEMWRGRLGETDLELLAALDILLELADPLRANLKLVPSDRSTPDASQRAS